MRIFLQNLILSLGLLVFLSDAQARADDLHPWPVTRTGLLDYSTRETAPTFINLQPPHPQPNFWTTPAMIRFYILGGLLLLGAAKK